MISFIIWIVGVVLAIKVAMEILNSEGDTVKKLLFVILLVLTSWVGLLLYYFWARERMGEWLK